MGLAELFTRDVQYTATDTKTGFSETFTVRDSIAPDWPTGDYSGGMSLPGAWRAALLLSDLLASVPWHAFRERNGVAERITPTPAFLDQPAPPDPRVVTFSSMALDLIWHGNAIALIASRNRDGWPTSYLPVPADSVQVRRAGPQDDPSLYEGEPVYLIGGRWRPASEVVHVKGPCRPGALRGMGVLEHHLTRTFALADEQNRQARSVGNAGVPSGVLKVDDTPDDPLEQSEADELKAAWHRSQQSRGVAVLNGRTSFEALAWDPTETQLLDARKFSLHEVALIFGLDPSWLGVTGASNTYQNIEQQALNLVRYSLAGHLARFEQTLTLHLPRGTEAKANLDAVLRADTLARYQAHEIGIRAGFITRDEARALEDRPALTPAQRRELTPARPPASAAEQDDDTSPNGDDTRD